MRIWGRRRGALLSGVALGVVAAFLMAADPVRAADMVEAGAGLPAVDGFNGKLEGFGGWGESKGFRSGSDFVGGGLGSLSLPVGHSFGFQLDGMAATRQGDFVGGAAGHLFTRDPSSHLIGLYGSGVGFDDPSRTRSYKIGAEAEAYLGRFTLSGVAGYEHVDAKKAFLGLDGSGARVFSDPKDGGSFFDQLDVSFYPTDDLKLSAGHRYVGRKHAAALGVEALMPVGGVGVSAFAEGRIGEEDYKAAWAGVKIYFGEDKSLIRRHRESDPPNRLKDDLFAASSRRDRVGAVPPPPPPPPGCEITNCGCVFDDK